MYHLDFNVFRSPHLFWFCPFLYFFWQVDAQLQVVRKLEEKERLLQGTINTAERELALRTQALDMNKRKVARCRHLIITSYVTQNRNSFLHFAQCPKASTLKLFTHLLKRFLCPGLGSLHCFSLFHWISQRSGIMGNRELHLILKKVVSVFFLQAQDSVLLSEDFRIQLEQVQQRLSLVREEVVENSLSREKESFNARRAQVTREAVCQSVRRHEARDPAVKTHIRIHFKIKALHCSTCMNRSYCQHNQ